MGFRRVLTALAAVFAALAVLLFAIGKGTSLEIEGELHQSINMCIAAQAGSGLDGYPVASSRIISARKTSGGGVAYLLAYVQGYSGTSSKPKVAWSVTKACRVVLIKDKSGKLRPDYCMLPRDGENYKSDFMLMFSPLTRLRISSAEKSDAMLKEFEEDNRLAAVAYLAESEKISNYSVALVEESKDKNIALKPLSLIKVRGSLVLTVMVTNGSGDTIFYDSAFKLERLSGEKYSELPLREGYAFSKGMSVLDKGGQNDMIFHLNAYFDDIEEGTYRLSAEICSGPQGKGEKTQVHMVFKVSK